MKITYTERNGILYPDLSLLNGSDYVIGKYGRMMLGFLKTHRRGTYTILLTEGRLNEYLHEVDETANYMIKNIIKDMAEGQGVTEELKANNPLKWVQEMNHIKACAGEIVTQEIFY